MSKPNNKFLEYVLDCLSCSALEVLSGMTAKEISLYARDHKNETAEEVQAAIIGYEASKPVEMSDRLASKIANKSAFVSPVLGLNGNIEYVTKGFFEQLTGLPGHISAELAVSNPELWTAVGAMFYQDSMIPHGVVGNIGESLQSICSFNDWDYTKARRTNAGRNVPLNSKFTKPVVVLPPTHRPPKAKMVTPGADSFLAMFGAAKGSKYESTMSSAHSLGIHELDHVLAIDLMWSSKNIDADGYWTKTEYQNSKGEFLFFLEGDGSHWMNTAAKDLFEASVVQFRSVSLSIAMQVKTHAEMHKSNLTSASLMREIYSLLNSLSTTKSEEFADELAFQVEGLTNNADILTLLEAILKNQEAWTMTRSTNPIWNGKVLLVKGEQVHIKGVGEIAYNNLAKPECEVDTTDAHFIKGLAICPNVKEEFAKIGGTTPTVFASPFETKGKNKGKVERMFVDHVIANHGDAVGPFIAYLPLDKMVFSVHERLKSGKTSIGYQQYCCVPKFEYASKESQNRYNKLIEEIRDIFSEDFDLPDGSKIEDWEQLSRELQFVNLFGHSSDNWHEAIVDRLKSDSLNLSLIQLFGEDAYFATEVGRQNYYETRNKMAEILFKGAGVGATYARYLKPTRHQVSKMRKTEQELGSCSGITEVPEFWKGRKGRLGHGAKVLTSTSRVPVVTMGQPVVEYDRMSKYVEGAVAPPRIAITATVGDYDGDGACKAHFTPKSIYDQIVGKKNKRTALIQAIVVATHSLNYIDVYDYDVESVTKDKTIDFGAAVVDGKLNFDAIVRTVEPMQGFIGTYAYHFCDSLVYGLMEPEFGMIQQGAYQGEIDMQGGVLNKTYLLTSSDLTIDGNSITIKDDAFEKSKATFDMIQRVLLRPAWKKWSARSNRMLHWELLLPTDLKQRMQAWARSRTFGKGEFFEFTDTDSTTYHVHRSICLGWRRVFTNKYNETVVRTGTGLREINPFAPSLPIQDRWLRLRKGMGKRKARDLTWLNEEFNWFEDIPKGCSTGKFSAVTHVFDACRAIAAKAKPMPDSTEFWCPLGKSFDSDVATKLETILLKDLKRINGYVFLPLEKAECIEVANNFLAYMPFFRWTEDVSYVEELLGLSGKVREEFGFDDSCIPALINAITDEGFWKAEHNLFSNYNDEPLFVHRRTLHLLDRDEEDEEALDELKEVEEWVWNNAKNKVQRLFEAFAANSSDNFCNIWEGILPKYESEQVEEAYVALTDAHNEKSLSCICCKRAFDKFTTPMEVGESGKIVSDFHNILIRVDKNIDNMILSEDADPVLLRLQEKRKLRFIEARGAGQQGYQLDSQAARMAKSSDDYKNLEKKDVIDRKNL